VSLPRIEGTVILAFDVSGSMAADDMQPTRMEAAKTAARDFIEQQPPQRAIGVVSFSESGFSVQAPTNDPGPVRPRSIVLPLSAARRWLTAFSLPSRRSRPPKRESGRSSIAT